ncbi:PspA-associated protein PspAA [Sulfobacillus harzensis]|uniref:PspA-associated domain-containing protein n=1 Tax=Sulfobacillus harzensis TaxID=2729629 RepID=A0A7Y0L5J3_9FIRM|nr:hypothetical protein [Sulfobacillus harzensis]NMP23620.1 hypothetical protein [Sulfobacillus harzensis]
MIVRILSEGQYRVDGSTLETLKKLDDALMEALSLDQADRFHSLLTETAEVVRQGEPLDPAHLVESDLILPASDTTLEEAKRLFSDPA